MNPTMTAAPVVERPTDVSSVPSAQIAEFVALLADAICLPSRAAFAPSAYRKLLHGIEKRLVLDICAAERRAVRTATDHLKLVAVQAELAVHAHGCDYCPTFELDCVVLATLEIEERRLLDLVTGGQR